MTVAHVNRIGTAVPDHDVHQTFIGYVHHSLPDRRSQRLFRRMAERAAIEHRYSCLRPGTRLEEAADGSGFYRRGRFPGTGARMERFGPCALDLMRRAVAALDLGPGAERITHLVLASCTGFTAPGLDQQLMAALGLDPSIERTVVGFMGCAAAVNALKVAHHIVRSEPDARVLVVNVELCTLHMQDTSDLEKVLSALLFGDGCTAALVTREPVGLALSGFRAVTIPDTGSLITWTIGDQGFDMTPVGRGAEPDLPGAPPRGPAQRRHLPRRPARRGRPLGRACGRPHDPRRGGGGAEPRREGAALVARHPARVRQHVVLHADVRARPHAPAGRRARPRIRHGVRTRPRRRDVSLPQGRREPWSGASPPAAPKRS